MQEFRYSFMTLRLFSTCLAFTMLSFLCAQGQISLRSIDGSNMNTINTAVPFITIAPDGRAGGLGDVGAASTPDVYSQHWNASKYPFIEKKAAVSLSFTPWLRKIIPDINLAYLTGYYKIDERNGIIASMRYFTLGSINYSSTSGTTLGSFTPIEMTFDAAYSRKITDHFSASLTGRYIRSDLTRGQHLSGEETMPGTSFAADLGMYYEREIWLGDRNIAWALGMNLSNFGTPIHYTSDAAKVPIPTILRTGGRVSLPVLDDHNISFMFDAQKYLVPTPPYGEPDSTGSYQVLHGFDTPESILSGMLQSFYDAPGYILPDGTRSVLLEELHEIQLGFGMEYIYRNFLSARIGYFHEHASKGNRKYMTFGVGHSWTFLRLDAAYLLPANGQDSPLANTIKLSLSFAFGAKEI